MSRPQIKTDSSHFEIKVRLREDNLPAGPCCVLDLFGGTGRIWDTIKQRNPKRDIRVLRIDKKGDRGGVYLVGDNRKYMESLDPGRFNVIDMDAYGIPHKQLAWLFERKHGHPKTIFVTFIQTVYGRLPDEFLEALGYTREMIKKCPSLFYRHGFQKLKQYLANNGIKSIRHYSDYTWRKHYLCFVISKEDHKRAKKYRIQ